MKKKIVGNNLLDIAFKDSQVPGVKTGEDYYQQMLDNPNQFVNRLSNYQDIPLDTLQSRPDLFKSGAARGSYVPTGKIKHRGEYIDEPYNAWFPTGEFMGKEIPETAQDIIGFVSDVAALSPGRAINVSGKATSLLDDIIARNKQSVKNIAKGPTTKELDEARRMLPKNILDRVDFIESSGKPLSEKEAIDFFSKLRNSKKKREAFRNMWDEEQIIQERGMIADYYKDKMHLVPDELIDEFQIENTLGGLHEKMFGIPKKHVLDEVGLDKANMNMSEILQYINKGRGPKVTYPMGGKEEIARKAGILTNKDIDYQDIPTFIRNKLK